MQALNGDDSAAAPHDLDSTEYDPVDHLNSIFSHPSTLTSAPDVSTKLQSHCRGLDASIDDLTQRRAASDAESLARMRQAQSELSSLFQKIDRLRERALQTEQMITDMTADIKRLDGTKKNLTLSMTALKRLQMLTTAYEQLRGLGKSRQYRECASLLAAVIQLMAHFKSYRSIDQIATLGRKVAELQRELLDQVCEDFEDAFSKNEAHKRRGTLSEACAVMDALGENAKARLITWYCNASLREYRQIFRGSDEAASLDNISRRYAWFHRVLKTYDAEHAAVFPAHWRVNEMLANAFCQSTREDFKAILQKSARRENGQTLDVGLLLSCLQETLDFEHALEKKFAGDQRGSMDTINSADEKPKAFEQAISEAFEPYLSLWVEAQDRHMAELIPKYRQQPVRSEDEDFHAQLVLPSSGELFGVYRVDLAQCAKLSTGSRLLELSKTFGKYLDQYSQQVLFYNLNDKPGPAGPSVENTIILLNTADYCYVTCNQLEERIKGRIDAEFKQSVDLQSQADAFMGIASAAVRVLARKVEAECEPSWREMRVSAWSRMENVSDQSSYVPELQRAIRSKSGEIMRLLQHKQQYARAFCDALVDSMTNLFLANVAAGKPISEVGAEQLLLDSYALKKTLTDLPNVNAETPVPPQPTYAKRVASTLSKVDPLLKTLQVRPDPPEALVQAYLIHIGDRSEGNFRSVLELKGISRKQEQAPLMQLFNAHKAAQADGLVASSPLLASLPVMGASAAQASATPGTTFGTALFGGAGADRFGSPASTAASSNIPSRVSSPPHGAPGVNGTADLNPLNIQVAGQTGNLNDNLRNIGKFFRRDFAPFGANKRAANAPG